jgi:hypothetical protein
MLLHTVNRLDYTADRQSGATLEGRCRLFAMRIPTTSSIRRPTLALRLPRRTWGSFAHSPDATAALGGFAITLATSRACSFKVEATC